MRGRGGRGRHRERHPDRQGRGEYGRTTITVPCDLKQRMKSVGDYVNWSSVACKAFDAKLQDLVQQEEVENLDQVVERLRKLNAERTESETSKAGTEAGKHWAMNRATPAQLETLENFRDEMSASQWRELFQHRKGVRELTHCLMHGGDRAPRRGGGRMFWRQILDERPDNPDFFAGFADGAIEVWRAVKDRV